MFFPFFISIFQICFIPGFIVLSFLKIKSNDSRLFFAPVFSFALSLVLNYVIVVILTYFHIYTKFSLTILILAEFILLGAIFFNRKLKNQKYNVKEIFTGLLQECNMLISTRKTTYDLIRSGIFILSVLLLLFLLGILILNTGNIFQNADAIFSWNRWAIDFSNNKFPSGTYHYPQLIPANWSISYVLCEYPLQFIPAAIMPLFLIFPVYSFIILGIKKGSSFYFSSAFLLFLSLRMLNWRDGWVDVPVAFFSILIYICLILIKEDDRDSDKKKFILLSVLFACGSAVTKQSGLFIVLIYPLLLFILIKDKFEWTYKKILNLGLVFLVLIITIVMPFYVSAELGIRNHINTSEISYVTKEIYKGASYFDRLLNAFKQFSNVFSSRILLIVCIYPYLLSFKDKTFRLLNLSFVLPYSLIWAVYFSYDIRNSSIIIPYFCLCIGVGLDIILRRYFTLPAKN